MYRIIVEKVTKVAGQKSRVEPCYKQEFEDINVLDLVARINAPPPKVRERKKKEKPA